MQGVSLDVSKKRCIRLKGHSFAGVQNLGLFKVYNSQDQDNYQSNLLGSEDVETFSPKLTYFSWEACPFRSLPLTFSADNLVRLDMQSSNLEKLWDDVQNLGNLKYVDLSDSPHLIGIPNLSKAKNLEELILNNCESLEIVPDSIQSIFISLSGCSKLMKAPKISCRVEQLDLSRTAIEESPFVESPSRLARLNLSHCRRLERLSSSICDCRLLRYLYLNECPKLKWLPNDFGGLENLEILHNSGTVFEEVPSSIAKLGNLLSLCLSRGMDQVPLNWSPASLSGLRSLIHLDLANCGITRLPNDLGELCLLKKLDISGNNFDSMPAIKNLSKLKSLDISYCESLISLPQLPSGICIAANNCSSLQSISDLSFLFSSLAYPQRVNFANCFNLNLSEILLQESYRRICNTVCCPGNEIPEWFSFRNKGSFITLERQPNWNHKSFLGCILCAVVAFPEQYNVEDEFEVTCSFLVKSEYGRFETYERALRCWFGYGNEIVDGCYGPDAPEYISSNHLFMGFDYKVREPYCDIVSLEDEVEEMGSSKMFIKFHAGSFEVKQCGVHPLFDQTEENKVLSRSRPEGLLIDTSGEDILNEQNKLSPNDNMDLVGVQLSIQKIESLLCTGSNDVRHVGIWGIGGIGKTTIARAVFNKISNQFDGSYFAVNVREESEKNSELTCLRQEILFAILEDRHANMRLSFTKERLGRKKVLLVFDDVTSVEQIQKLIGNSKNLGIGSGIIITARDKHVLRNCGVSDADIYEVKGLSEVDALQLFRKYAFGQNCPTYEDYAELSNKIISYAKGVPLALIVLGSFFRGRTKQEWEMGMEKRYPLIDIEKVLRRSYDGLDDEEKSIFLDIAFLFKGWKTYIVKDILNASGFSAQIGLSQLVDKSLISISYDTNTIDMHDLLREMGRGIIRRESNDPGECTRLWHSEDINDVLRNNTGAERVEGICLDISKISHIRLEPHAFARMHNLRLFKVYNSQDQENYQNVLEMHNLGAFKVHNQQDRDNYLNKLWGFEDLESFSTELTYFSWQAYPSRSLPSNFSAENLVRLDMPSSNLEKLWDDVQNLENLKYINLSHSRKLIEIPNLFKAKNLEELILNDCTSLSEITPSIQNLHKLVRLCLSNCSRLGIVPDGVRSTCISLRSCSNLVMAPRISCKVQKLDLSRTAIEESPFIEYSSRLAELNLSHCPRLESLSSSICDCKLLNFLYLNECPKLKRLPNDFGDLEDLEILDNSGTVFIEVPSSITKLGKLRSLCLSRVMDHEPLNCALTSLSGLRSLMHLELANCQITMLPNDLGQLCLVEKLDLSGNNFKSMPAINDLSKLKVLNISYCKRLISLPKLSRGICIAAYNCSSLTAMSDSSFLLSRKVWPQRVNFANCSKLNLPEILLKESCRKVCNAVCYPGNEIPDWFSFKFLGSSITLEGPPNWKEKRFLGYIMCAVVAFPERYYVKNGFEVTCILLIRRDEGFEAYECPLRCWFGYGNEIEKGFNGPKGPDYIESNHVFLGFDYKARESYEWGSEAGLKNFMEDMGNSRMLIKYYAGDGDFEVKKCGFHFVFAQEEKDQSQSSSRHLRDEEKEDEEPPSKIFKISNSSERESNPRLLPSEKEEGGEPQSKRFKSFESPTSSRSKCLMYPNFYESDCSPADVCIQQIYGPSDRRVNLNT